MKLNRKIPHPPPTFQGSHHRPLFRSWSALSRICGFPYSSTGCSVVSGIPLEGPWQFCPRARPLAALLLPPISSNLFIHLSIDGHWAGSTPWLLWMMLLWTCVYVTCLGLPWWLNGKESACNASAAEDVVFDPWLRKIPWRRSWHPTAVFLPGESHGQRRLEGHSPWVTKSWTRPKQLSMACIYLFVSLILIL